MTLIQLIDHLKQALEDNGGQDMEVKVDRGAITGPSQLWGNDIDVDPEAKTITFT